MKYLVVKKHRFEQSLIESNNKRANDRNSEIASAWKVIERENFCDYIKKKSLQAFWKLGMGLGETLSEFFSIEYFNVVPKEIIGGNYVFQSIILRK